MGSVFSCSELTSVENVVLLPFRTLLQQPLLHPAVLSTVRQLLQLLSLHGKSPSKDQDPTSAEDPSSLQDSSCLPATANNNSELMLLWEPSTTLTQKLPSEVPSPAIHNTALSQPLTTITQSSL